MKELYKRMTLISKNVYIDKSDENWKQQYISQNN